MSQYLIKLFVSAAIIVFVSEISKKSVLVGAVTASLPLVSILALTWLYMETKDIEKVSALSTGIFWLVIPSLALFIALPLLLKSGTNFYLSLIGASGVTVLCYFSCIWLLGKFGIKI